MISKLNDEKDRLKLKISKKQQTISGLNSKLESKKMEMAVRKMELRKKAEEIMPQRHVKMSK